VTCTDAGTETAKCDACDKTDVRELAATGHSFTDGVCTVCGAADPNYVPPAPETPAEDLPTETPADEGEGNAPLTIVLVAVAAAVIVAGAAVAIVVVKKKKA
jgi:hypothetical protein